MLIKAILAATVISFFANALPAQAAVPSCPQHAINATEISECHAERALAIFGDGYTGQYQSFFVTIVGGKVYAVSLKELQQQQSAEKAIEYFVERVTNQVINDLETRITELEKQAALIKMLMEAGYSVEEATKSILGDVKVDPAEGYSYTIKVGEDLVMFVSHTKLVDRDDVIQVGVYTNGYKIGADGKFIKLQDQTKPYIWTYGEIRKLVAEAMRIAYAKGYQDGYEDGYRDGYNDGYRAGVASVS